jgi:predicted metal-dependent enzyme (double-stranded beta helix superfamily)
LRRTKWANGFLRCNGLSTGCAPCAPAGEARWRQARPLLAELLADPELRARSLTWPKGVEPGANYPANLLFYEDPDHGFAINALIKDANETTSVHDHAHTWTLYGVLEGGERVLRYARKDDGKVAGRAVIEPVGDHQVAPGYIDLVPPGDIHAEFNGPQRTIAVILRSAKVDGFSQNHFQPEQGTVTQRPGPRQVPYEL